jgi:hypothetical protein
MFERAFIEEKKSLSVTDKLGAICSVWGQTVTCCGFQ